MAPSAMVSSFQVGFATGRLVMVSRQLNCTVCPVSGISTLMIGELGVILRPATPPPPLPTKLVTPPPAPLPPPMPELPCWPVDELVKPLCPPLLLQAKTAQSGMATMPTRAIVAVHLRLS